MDTRQKLTPPRPGSPTRANDLDHIISAVKRMFVAGQGILLRPMGDQIAIHVDAGPVSAGGGGGGEAQYVKYVSALTKETLPDPADISPYTLGFVMGGDQRGMVCVPGSEGDTWEAINFFEAAP